MGLVQHHAIIATTWSDDSIHALRGWIVDLDPGQRDLFTPPIRSRSNSYYTIVLTPDGSNEGRLQSNEGNKFRARFIDYLKAHEHWNWVEVNYGELGTKISGTNCEDLSHDATGPRQT